MSKNVVGEARRLAKVLISNPKRIKEGPLWLRSKAHLWWRRRTASRRDNPVTALTRTRLARLRARYGFIVVDVEHGAIPFPEVDPRTRTTEQPADVVFTSSQRESTEVSASFQCTFSEESGVWECRSGAGERITVRRDPAADVRIYNPVGRSLDTARVVEAQESHLTDPRVLRSAAILRIPPTLAPWRQQSEAVNALATGTPIAVSPGSPLASREDGSAVHVVPDDATITMGRLAFDQPFAFEAAVAKAHRIGFWEVSTWAAADTCFSRLGFATVEPPTVTVVLASRRPALLTAAINRVVEQTYGRIQLLIGLHGASFNRAELASLIGSAGIVAEMHSFDPNAPLGEVLDQLVERASGRLIAKFDDDDWYSREHVADLVAAWQLSGAEVVGKAANFVYLEGSDRTLAYDDEFQFREVAHIPGGTMLAPRDLLADYRFGRARRAVDSVLLRKVRGDGGVLFSTTRQGFMRRRHSGHTAEFDDDWYVRRAHGRVLFGMRLDLAGVSDAEKRETRRPS